MSRLETDTAYAANDWIETHTGRKFFVMNPTVEAITIFDIAHALSNQCRYSGHTDPFYSTAQHCCLCAAYADSKGASPIDSLQILMHDAAEAYVVDVPRPIKQFLPEYRKIEFGVNATIREWLRIGRLPLPAIQDEIDSRIIVDERRAVMRHGLHNEWLGATKLLGIKVVPWASRWAEQQFLMRYAAYTYAAFGAHLYLDESYVPGRLQASCDTAEGVNDLVEVDFLGNCAKVKRRDPDSGMLIRDRDAAVPAPAWEWMHGEFTRIEGAEDVVRKTV